MTNLPVSVQSSTSPVSIVPELAAAVEYAKAEKAPATRKAYKTDFAIFQAWCGSKSLGALPATVEAVAAFLAAEAGKGAKASTLARRVAAIRYAHKLAGLETPTDAEAVKATMRGIRRTLGAAKVRKAPALPDRLRAMISLCPATLAGKRDRALLLLGFAGAFRRSELVALDVADIEEGEAGMKVTLRRSKTDQEGHGRVVPVARGMTTCPVQALREWQEAAGIVDGPVFRSVNKAGRISRRGLSDRSVANIVKFYAGKVGLNPELFAGHSLRAGFLTASAAAGRSIFKMMDVSGHRSVDTLRGYVRDAELFKDHAGAGLL